MLKKATKLTENNLQPGAIEPYISPNGKIHGYRYCCAGCGEQSFLNIKDSSGRGWSVTSSDATDIETLSLTPSIHHTAKLVEGCGWHGWLRNGTFESI